MFGSGKYCLSHRNCLNKLSNIGVPVQRMNSIRVLPALKMCKGHCADFSFPNEYCVAMHVLRESKGNFFVKINLTIIGKPSLKVFKYLEPV